MTLEKVCVWRAWCIIGGAVGTHSYGGIIVEWTSIMAYFPFTLGLGGFGVWGLGFERVA